MGSCCSASDGDSNTSEGAEYLSPEEKNKICETWHELCGSGDGWERLVREAVTQEGTGVRRLIITAGNQLLFGAMETRLRREAEQMVQFLNGLIINLALVEQDITLACEHYGSEDAETEIRDSAASCKISEASTFLSILISHMTHSNDQVAPRAWRKFATMILHSMKDGAYWAEERWGVHLMSHNY